MRTLIALVMLAVAASAAPPNNAFGSRINLGSPTSVATTGTNVDATLESFEDDLDGATGATVWWRWKAPATGWVRIDTIGSEIDTVLRIATGTNVAGTLVGYNDDWDASVDARIGGSGTSSLTFFATINITYNIGIGGFVADVDPEEGNVSLNITTGAAAQPLNWPSSLVFAPDTVTVSTLPANVTATLAVAGAAGTGDASFSMMRPNGETVTPPEVSGSTWTSGGPGVPWVLTIPRYAENGTWFPVVELETASGEFLAFGDADSGTPYLLPVAGVAQELEVISNVIFDDIDAPVVTSLAAIPAAVNVNAAQAIIPLSATVTDNRSGANQVEATLYHPTDPDLDLEVALTLTAGTVTSGTWTGSLTIPVEYPSGTYAVHVYVHDTALSEETYGVDGGGVMPGGNRNVVVTGGGEYWEWAYGQIYGSSNAVGLDDDPNLDGITNLNCYAYGIDPLGSTGAAGLPAISLTGPAPKRLEVGYRKRVSATSGLTYAVEFSDNLSSWTPSTGTPVVVNVDDTWDHVSIPDSETTTTKPARYARVRATYTDP